MCFSLERKYSDWLNLHGFCLLALDWSRDTLHTNMHRYRHAYMLQAITMTLHSIDPLCCNFATMKERRVHAVTSSSMLRGTLPVRAIGMAICNIDSIHILCAQDAQVSLA